jgi:pyruvate formate lyase activating enzyme
MIQLNFLRAFLPLLRAADLHVALDTCGAVAWAGYEEVLPFIDLVLYDLKAYDPDCHQASTGIDNYTILENSRRIAATGVPMWIRTPIIPGHTANAANVSALAKFISTELPTVRRWDLLAYTNLGRPKYARLDRSYALEEATLLTEEEMMALHALAAERVPGAVWSGATRTERR